MVNEASIPGSETPAGPPGLRQLVRTCHRGWALAILADLARHNGTRVAELAHRLSAPRNSIRNATIALAEQGLIERVDGHGHPLRPEVVLSLAGVGVAPHAAKVLARLQSTDLRGLERGKWVLPTLLSVGSGRYRFSDVRRTLAPITDRALVHALQTLGEGKLVDRSVGERWRTRIRYAPTDRGTAVLTPLKLFAEALRERPTA